MSKWLPRVRVIRSTSVPQPTLSPPSHPNAPNIELGIAGDGATETNAPQRGKLSAGQQYSVPLSYSPCGSAILRAVGIFEEAREVAGCHIQDTTHESSLLVIYLTLAGCATSDQTLDPSESPFSALAWDADTLSLQIRTPHHHTLLLLWPLGRASGRKD